MGGQTRSKRNRSPQEKEELAYPIVCRPEMMDPWSIIISYTRGPGFLRASCSFLNACWEHALYLEGELPCPYWSLDSAQRGQPRISADDAKSEGQQAQPRVPIKSEWVPYLGSNSYGLGGDVDWDQEKYRLRLHFARIPKVVSLDEYVQFHGNCAAISVIQMADLEELGASTLSMCYQVRELLLHDLPTFTDTLSSFWEYENIERLSLRNLPALEELAEGAFSTCGNLEEVTLQRLPSLTKLGSQFLCTSGVVEFRLEGLGALETIGDCFLFHCTSLREVVLGDLPVLKAIGSDAMAACDSLTKVHIFMLPKLADIGDCLLDDLPFSKPGNGLSDPPTLIISAEEPACHPTLVTALRLALTRPIHAELDATQIQMTNNRTQLPDTQLVETQLEVTQTPLAPTQLIEGTQLEPTQLVETPLAPAQLVTPTFGVATAGALWDASKQVTQLEETQLVESQIEEPLF